MLPRSSSTSSCLQTLNENLTSSTTLHHYESLQNLQRSKISHPLTVDNNHLNLPIVPHPKKENIPVDEKKTEQQVEKLRRTIVQDDIENIQERLNGMLIAVPSPNENAKSLLTQQKSTTEYFTPKISIEENDENDLDRNILFFLSSIFDHCFFCFSSRRWHRISHTSILRCSHLDYLRKGSDEIFTQLRIAFHD